MLYFATNVCMNLTIAKLETKIERLSQNYEIFKESLILKLHLDHNMTVTEYSTNLKHRISYPWIYQSHVIKMNVQVTRSMNPPPSMF